MGMIFWHPELAKEHWSGRAFLLLAASPAQGGRWNCTKKLTATHPFLWSRLIGHVCIVCNLRNCAMRTIHTSTCTWQKERHRSLAHISKKKDQKGTEITKFTQRRFNLITLSTDTAKPVENARNASIASSCTFSSMTLATVATSATVLWTKSIHIPARHRSLAHISKKEDHKGTEITKLAEVLARNQLGLLRSAMFSCFLLRNARRQVNDMVLVSHLVWPKVCLEPLNHPLAPDVWNSEMETIHSWQRWAVAVLLTSVSQIRSIMADIRVNKKWSPAPFCTPSISSNESNSNSSQLVQHVFSRSLNTYLFQFLGRVWMSFIFSNCFIQGVFTQKKNA